MHLRKLFLAAFFVFFIGCSGAVNKVSSPSGDGGGVTLPDALSVHGVEEESWGQVGVIDLELAVSGSCVVGEGEVSLTCPSATVSGPVTVACSDEGSYALSCTYIEGMEQTDEVVISQGETSLTYSVSIDTSVPSGVGITVPTEAVATGGSYPYIYSQQVDCEVGATVVIAVGETTEEVLCASSPVEISATVFQPGGFSAQVYQVDPLGNVGASQSVSLYFSDNSLSLQSVSAETLNLSSGSTVISIEGTCVDGIAEPLLSCPGLAPQVLSCNVGEFQGQCAYAMGNEVSGGMVVSQENQSDVVRAVQVDLQAPVALVVGAASAVQDGGSYPAVAAYPHSLLVSVVCEVGATINLVESAGGILVGPVSQVCGASPQTVGFELSTEGSSTLSLTQTDALGNVSSSVLSLSVTSLGPPNLTLEAPAAGSSFQASVTLSGQCTDGLDINFSGAGVLSPFSSSTACSSGTYSQEVFFSAGDGTKVITVNQNYGGTASTSVSRDFVRDNVAPALTQATSASSVITKTDTVSFGGACESGLDIEIKVEEDSVETVLATDVACSSGVWSYSTPVFTTDNVRTFYFKQTDLAGNSGEVAAQWERDTVDPTLALGVGYDFQKTASDSVVIEGACEANLSQDIQISGEDTASVACSVSGTWSYTTSSKTTDGLYSYVFSLTDDAGNSTLVTSQWERDTSGPQLTLSAPSLVQNTEDTASFSGGCTDGVAIDVTGAESATLTCSSGNWNFTTSTQSTDASRAYTFSQTNALSVTTTVNGTWVRDTTAPAFDSGGLSVASGAAASESRFVEVAFSATDALSKVQDICLKLVSSLVPDSSDPCWVPVSGSSIGQVPALSVQGIFTDYPLGLVSDLYSVYGWVRDELGNISANGAVASTDVDDIELKLGLPPVALNVTATNTDGFSLPLTQAETVVGAGGDLFIKWVAYDPDLNAGGTARLPVQGVNLYFTTDDVTWTKINSSLLSSSDNSTSCSLPVAASDEEPGCYKWSSSTASYFKIRVEVLDSSDMSALVSSNDLNTSVQRVIVGNTDLGLGSSAQAAILLSRTEGNGRFADRDSLAVTSNGRIFFRDTSRGILEISPLDGKVSLFLAQTGVSAGDGGSVASATLKHAGYIAMDASNNLYIYDYDRIRKVDLSLAVPSISTIIGGGSSTSITETDPLALELENFYAGESSYRNGRKTKPFTVFPNGSVFFRAKGGGIDNNSGVNSDLKEVWLYDGSTVSSFVVGGAGGKDWADLDISTCDVADISVAFDPGTNQILYALGTHEGVDTGSSPAVCKNLNSSPSIGFRMDSSFQSSGPHPAKPANSTEEMWTFIHKTGLDGKIYAINREDGEVVRYDGSTQTWETVLGTSVSGSCDDGTPALSCNVTPQDVFVTSLGSLYFVESGMIRTLDTSGNVVTVAGQPTWFGDGGLPTDARISEVLNVDFYEDGATEKYVFRDRHNGRIREFDIGGSISTIAGNGLFGGPAIGGGALAVNEPLDGVNNHIKHQVVVSPTGEVYTNVTNNSIGKLNRTTGEWELVWGAGSGTWYYASGADGSAGSGILTRGPSANVVPMGFGNGKVLAPFGVRYYDSGQSKYFQRHRMLKLLDVNTGVQSHLAGIVQDPATSGLCADGASSSTCPVPWVSAGHRMMASYDTGLDHWVWGPRGAKGLYTFKEGGLKGTLVTTSTNMNSFAYDENNGFVYYCGNDGIMRRVTTSSGAESLLTWPVSTMKCQEAYGLKWNATRGVLLIPFKQNGLWGVLEHTGAVDP